MSSPSREPAPVPLIALAFRAFRAMEADMVRSAHDGGHPEVKRTHNAVFATLRRDGMRTVDMAAEMGITRQSMGEVVRDMVELGLLEMRPDPADRRAKIVVYTDEGWRLAAKGYSHIKDLERRFAEELGSEDYEAARRVLERVPRLLAEDD
ncbi:MarR family winged helix-turn-helix transcriptional regulator [Oryzobacter terrae]|uniref:MarR family winged helix-turn-helix transcriptional regulator n=1 Tax=Oryzobacter terrae TaxID=1620385 RepID=UPI0036706D1C